jgi:hypothetical protein
MRIRAKVAALAMLALLVGCAPQRVRQIEYQGHQAYRLTDGRVEAIVVPELRRVMHFGEQGGPNRLWVGKAIDKTGFQNFGGEKAWPWPQSQWYPGTDKAWPPPDDQAGVPGYEVLTVGRDFIRLQSAPLRALPGRFVREYRIAGGSKLQIDTWLMPEPADADLTGWAAWSVVQLPRPSSIHAFTDCPAESASVQTMMGAMVTKVIGDRTVWIDPAPARHSKVGLDASWLRARYEDWAIDMVALPLGRHDGRFDPAERAQVYAQPVKPGEPDEGYIELELTSGKIEQPGTGIGLRVELSMPLDRPTRR